jgi:hypothetical protein
VYDLGKVGRFKVNSKLFKVNFAQSKRILQPEDILGTLNYILKLNKLCDKLL